ncbi:MAG: alpha/beta hydrolase [Gammaproteobacteria bacterium]
MNKTIVALAMTGLLVSGQVWAAQTEASYAHIPTTVSEEAAAIIRMLPDPSLKPAAPAHDDIKAWTAIQREMAAIGIKRSKPIVDKLDPIVTDMKLGGVPVLDIKPRNWKDNGKVMLYTHGGAYTLFGAHSTLGSAALMAATTGLRVISIDYTLAPHARWQQTTDQVVSVFKALREQGYAMKDMAIYGDSAGGSLAAGSVLKMRDKGVGMPAAVVLWSPWSDITDTGDSYVTLKRADPAYLYDSQLKTSADAYADPKDQKHPYVSPVYGDYSKGFPPTLIQGGSKEIFLSNFIRHYQALDTAGQIVKLDIYEGMIHVFQAALAGTPESKIALGKVDAFLKQHLGK